VARDIDPNDIRKIVAFDGETWHALVQLGRDRDRTLQELADEAFGDLLKKHGRPVTLRESLKASVQAAAGRTRAAPPAKPPPGRKKTPRGR
jgi:hypothetical protein